MGRRQDKEFYDQVARDMYPLLEMLATATPDNPLTSQDLARLQAPQNMMMTDLRTLAFTLDDPETALIGYTTHPDKSQTFHAGPGLKAFLEEYSKTPAHVTRYADRIVETTQRNEEYARQQQADFDRDVLGELKAKPVNQQGAAMFEQFRNAFGGKEVHDRWIEIASTDLAIKEHPVINEVLVRFLDLVNGKPADISSVSIAETLGKDESVVRFMMNSLSDAGLCYIRGDRDQGVVIQEFKPAFKKIFL